VVLVLLFNLVGFVICTRPSWSGGNVVYHSCTSSEGASWRGIFTRIIGAGGVVVPDLFWFFTSLLCLKEIEFLSIIRFVGEVLPTWNIKVCTIFLKCHDNPVAYLSKSTNPRLTHMASLSVAWGRQQSETASWFSIHKLGAHHLLSPAIKFWHLGSLIAANWVSFDFNVSCSSCWGYSLINTHKLKKKNCHARKRERKTYFRRVRSEKTKAEKICASFDMDSHKIFPTTFI